MKIMIVVGARPNFMKAAPILETISRRNASLRNGSGTIHPVLVHTGQHYDAAMSEAFFSDLNLPPPDVFLGVGSGSHAAQTAEIMKRFEEVLLREKPEMVMVVGDVNSTVACALVAAKISYDTEGRRPLIAHVEAGLRSFDRSMPEECNRVVTDHLSDLLFVTEPSALENLEREGISKQSVFFVGNTMIDSLRRFEGKAAQSKILERLGISRPNEKADDPKPAAPYVLLTLHRPANVDRAESFVEILEGIRDVTASYPTVFPAHPRTEKQIQQNKLERYFSFPGRDCEKGESERPTSAIMIVEPLGYLDFVCLMKNARLVVTDSGGIQEETTCLNVPCVTVRDNTERPVTLTSGTNVLGGTRRGSIREAIRRQLARNHQAVIPEMWDGTASSRIIDTLMNQNKLRASAAQTSATNEAELSSRH
jgi:UDP-N-acetylglucosamine 2-epimerase (non-hydrolysing)